MSDRYREAEFVAAIKNLTGHQRRLTLCVMEAMINTGDVRSAALALLEARGIPNPAAEVDLILREGELLEAGR